MKKGSPEGYNAENGSEQPAQKPQTGEPNERQPLYRIRCPQEKRQLLRQRRRRADFRRGQAASNAPSAAAVGPEAPGAMARRDGSDAVQRLDLRRLETVCGRIAGRTPGVDESHRRVQKEERQTGCAEDRGFGALQPAPGVLRCAGGDPRVAADAALPEPGGGAIGAHEEQNERAADGNGRGVQQAAASREEILQRTAGDGG